MFYSQFQEWWKTNDRDPQFTTLGDLSGSESIKFPIPLGVLQEDKTTLNEVLSDLPSTLIQAIHEKDFGNAFRWKMLEKVEQFCGPTSARNMSSDRELEGLRTTLRGAADKFIGLAARYTKTIDQSDDIRKIPDQFDRQGNYSDALFFKKSKEINDVADELWSACNSLVRTARRKLAIADPGETSENQS